MNDDFQKSVDDSLAVLAKRYKADDAVIDLRHSKYWDLLDDIKIHREAAIKLAKRMLTHSKSCERFFGISLLGQICNPVEDGEEDEADEIARMLADMLETETSIICLSGIANAIGNTHSKFAEEPLLHLSHNSDDNVRWSATAELGSLTSENVSEEVIVRLIELSQDKDPDIRDWATMHIGGMHEVKDERIVNALVTRLKDRHSDTKSEAIYGLAERNDDRGIEPLKKRLFGKRINDKDIESAGIYGRPELLEYLKKWDTTPGYLSEWAQKRCDPDLLVKDSIDDEWLGDEWYLNVKNGVRRPIKYKEWDGQSSPWKD